MEKSSQSPPYPVLNKHGETVRIKTVIMLQQVSFTATKTERTFIHTLVCFFSLKVTVCVVHEDWGEGCAF